MEKLFVSESLHNPDSEYLKSEVKKALQVFSWQLLDGFYSLVKTDNESDYSIIKYSEVEHYKTHIKRSLFHKYYIVFDSDDQFNNVIDLFKCIEYKWTWKYSKESPAYEVTSRGDRRYSPFFQKIQYKSRWITLEDYYHKYIKPKKLDGSYVQGTGHELMKSYLNQYRGLIYELLVIGSELPFSDMFDKNGGQNKWYSEILNEMVR